MLRTLLGLFRRNQKNLFHSFGLHNVSSTSYNAVARFIVKLETESEKMYCLDIGSNKQNDKYNTVDFVDGADYVGDVRGLFAPQSGSEPSQSLLTIPEGFFKLIKVSHLIEHIEWLYQDSLFEWLYVLLQDGGHIIIDTPNLDYVIKMYNKNMKRLESLEKLDYPLSDHPDFNSGNESDMITRFVPWVNFKLYSGCSFDGEHNDYHHTMYNIYWLGQVLERAGFSSIRIFEGQSLYGVACKKEQNSWV